ncbi:MAG: universal stress protein [Salinisphaera sp.]|nr:universal stress protein [Salinisphaera sp.]
MNYQSLLVYVSDPERSARTLEVASDIAARFDAHLTGIFIHEPAYYRYPLAYQTTTPPDFEDYEQKSQKLAEESEAAFEVACRASGVNKTEWRFVKGEPLRTLSLHARYADVVLMPQGDTGDTTEPGSDDPDLPAKVAIASARPVIAVPREGHFNTVGSRILLAWNASREATRAVTAALPLLRCAEKVSILVINPKTDDKGHGDDPGSDIALYLSRHQVIVDAIHVESARDSVAETLYQGTVELDANLICMGAYGHSRLRELVLGGVTRELMRDMPIPLLLAH